ncbi:MAG: cobyric acid synthase [Clostridiales bacterium]|nr:cobyric acid synthase [Clostridiales bacterium]
MAKIIMIQGTSSGVGKSIFSIALCRIFTQEGYKVAPFKVQNMSSNMHILNDGKKMARSQAICAYACNTKPDYKMNPILLVPNNNNTEVYLNGEYKGHMDRFSYEDVKEDFFNQAIISFNSLCEQNDIIVIEGAGSPVELNLIKNDIVNMGFAKKVSAPVLLISDISRGGVFASLYGTINLMPEEEQSLIKGIIINKFRGNIKYFNDGKNIIENICKIDVLGILPYFDINIEDEDSLIDNGVMKTKEMLLNNLKGEKTEDLYIDYLKSQFDTLANNFKDNLDMQKIYNILN